MQTFDQALAGGDVEIFESVMNDLIHELYYKARHQLEHADAMDVVFDGMMRL